MSESPTPDSAPIPNRMQFNIPDGTKIVLATTEAILTIEFAGSIIRLSSDEELNLQARTVSTDGDTYIGGKLFTENIQLGGRIYGANEVQIIGEQQSAIANATDESDAVTKLNALLAAIRTHGLIATS